MAQIPLNNFENISEILKSGENLIYQETEKDLTAIVLSVQITNVSMSDHFTSVFIQRSDGRKVYYLYEAIVPPNGALNPLGGNTVIKKGDALIIETSVDDALHANLSVLENANE